MWAKAQSRRVGGVFVGSQALQQNWRIECWMRFQEFKESILFEETYLCAGNNSKQHKVVYLGGLNYPDCSG